MVNAIICEFNPFHNGHKYLIEQAKRKTGAEYTVCIMSGNFVQRGEASVCDKHTRAAVAVRQGADLVIQIPTAHSLASAPIFAKSGVFLANALGVKTHLCFGSESEDISPLFRLAKVDKEEFAKQFRLSVSRGNSYAAAVTEAYSTLSECDASLLKSPNNLLAFEYIKASLGTDLDIVNITRKGVSHDSQTVTDAFASASFLRENPDKLSEFAPENVEYIFDTARFDDALLFSVYSKSAEELALFSDMNEGLENRFFAASKRAKNTDELFALVKSKRYTHAKIRRAALCVMLGIEKGVSKQMPTYIKVLAFNDRGRELLKTLNATATLPIITKPADVRDIDSAHVIIEERASDIYDYFSSRHGGGREYKISPIYIK